MKVLLLYPIFPKSFWSFEKAIAIIGKKAYMPPLGLITIAAILPEDWEYKLVDRNIREVEQSEWDWADLVMISGMIAQRKDMLSLIQETKQRGKPVAVGGPFPSSSPEIFEKTGVDFLITDEGEITLPMFVKAFEKGDKSGVFTSNGEKPDISTTPIPRYDLLDMDAYAVMPVQFSRGCPFNCEFCDIIILYGRKPRTKTPAQLLAELQFLYELGWREMIFLVDDNFIGNKRNAKSMLRELKPWLEERGYPFSFNTEASIDLASDQEFMDLMVECGFGSVFLGIETPDTESLKETGKIQNTRTPLVESVHKIMSSGIRVMAGFIIGFDGEKPGAGERIVEFIEQTAIPIAAFSMLQVLPQTALEKRLKKEGRLIDKSGDINNTTLINFIPSRPVDEIAKEFVDGFWALYDPNDYLSRVYRCYRILGKVDFPKKNKSPKKIRLKQLKGFFILIWLLGIRRETRWKFWPYLFSIYKHNPGGMVSFLTMSGQIEHFLEYRHFVKKQIKDQLSELKAKV